MCVVGLGRESDRYVLTDRRVPIARIAPYEVQRWVSADRVRAAFRAPVGRVWRRELNQARDESDMADPFAS